MKKLVAILISIFLATSAFTVYGAEVKKSDKAKSVFPMKVKDVNGYEVTIKKKPVKIIPLSLGSAEILFSIVDKSRITAISSFSDDPGISNIADAAKAVKKRASTANAENIIALQPDLVILEYYTDAKLVKQLRDAKITVYVYKTPSSIDKEKQIILKLASITGESAKGDELVKWMDNKLKFISDKLKALKPEERLTVLDYSEMGSTSGKGTNFDDVVTRAGLINLASKEGLEGWPVLSKEMIIKYNPDILSIPGWFYDSKTTGKSFTDKIINDKSLADVKAVKNKKIIAIDYKHLTSVSQYSVLGVEDTARLAYPELFK